MKKVDYLIKGNFISQRLNQFDQLTQAIEEFVSMPLENRVWPMIRGRRLTLLTDDPHLATQARFMEKQLCKHINTKLGLRIIGVDIKVMSLPLARKRAAISRKKASPQTTEVVRSIANSIADPELQAALKRLIDTDTRH
ncbi:MAG: Unknown protein [uncultured Thiotrichaceae bacterium]|uniref:DUF721 domain-containing protein n=1 Tax=uncultured Thiotrichaceae bacterium TaxID=298394 RepID=A0A6S6SIS2_9GAMM|nr:MAG: Unknown protein [uncultured Thiotrichaceae bacterium]